MTNPEKGRLALAIGQIESTNYTKKYESLNRKERREIIKRNKTLV